MNTPRTRIDYKQTGVMLCVSFPLDVKLKQGGGGYTTQTVAGERASSTYSAAVTLERLCDKLSAKLQLQPGALRAHKVQDLDEHHLSLWRIEKVTA